MSDSSQCWSCNASLASSPLLCPTCGKVQPVAETDYFQVFGTVTGNARKLGLNTTALEKEFHRLSRRLHPDRFARATPEEQQWSLAATALLNDAYRTLRDPLQRTEYLLKLEGLEIGEEHAGKGKTRQPPADLLEEVFDLNMQLEEMRMNRKMGEDDPSLQADLANARSRFEGLLAAVDSDLTAKGAEWDTGDNEVRGQAAKSMVALLDRRRYLRNLVRDVNEVLTA